MVNTHVVVNGSERIPLPGAIATTRADANVTIEVTLKLRRTKALPPLTGRPAVAMTRENLGANYGASKADIDKVAEVFGKFDLKEIGADPTTRSVRLSGTIAAMEEAFQVELSNYTHESGNYRGRVGPLYVPVEMKDIVEGVFGLDNRQSARRRRSAVRVDGLARSASVPSDWYIPSELAAHYNFPQGDGSGQTVGLLELGGGYFPDDLKQFCGFAKIPKPPQVKTISTDGAPTDIGRGSGDTLEVMLDIEVVAGICPKADIVVYFAENSEQGFLTCIDAAVHDEKNDPGILSISWAGAEESFTAQARRQFNSTMQEAALLGITVCVATGDDGSNSGVSDGLAHVQFPASSPYALAIGGTTIPKKGGKEPDVVWKDTDGFSTGGGVSAVFPRPDWQKDVTIQSVNPDSIVGRCIPDISANADGNVSPYLMVADGTKQPVGGTSAASPLVAGLLTLINASRPASDRVGYLTPLLYQASGAGKTTIGAAGCTDVQSGNNTTAPAAGYRAGEGYDAASGWGTPDGVKLAALLSPPPIDLTPLIIAAEHVL
jgi:kumamolisin